MRRKKRSWWFLGIALLSLCGFLYFINAFSPETLPFKLSSLNIQLPTLPIFFVLLFLFLFSFFAFVLNNNARGFLIGLFAVIYLLLRFYHFTQIFFLIMLVAIFTTLTLLFAKRA
ncbi:MAG TPA: hypothetical protein VLF68_05060 [Candidatus Saccharimonadales bacterium]|nr:hypothetical protein [Candidatus Saccharimonadales bacterium]